MQYIPGLWLFILSPIVLMSLFLVSWRHRNNDAGRAFLLMLASLLTWTVAFAFEIAVPDLNLKILLTKIQFIGIATVPLAWLYFTYSFLGEKKTLAFWGLVSLVPAMTNALVSIVPRPNIFWSNPSLIDGMSTIVSINYDYNFWFYYIHAPYSYVLLLFASYLLMQSILRSHDLYGKQIVLLFTASLLPILVNLIYVLGYSPFIHLDITSPVITVSCVIIAYALYRYQFLDLVPIARDMVVEKMNDGVIVLDSRNRIVDVNPASISILKLDKKGLGGEINQTGPLQFRAEMKKTLSANNYIDKTVKIEMGASHFDIRFSPIYNANREYQGNILLLRDVTEQEQLFKKIQAMAITDELTGLYNRRHMIERGEIELARIKRNKDKALSLIYYDIDNLKEVNDFFGHEWGDRLIVKVTEKVKEQIRSYDIFGRFGGDEFVIFLPDTEKREAEAIALRVNETLREILITEELSRFLVSISAGVVSSKDIEPSALSLKNMLGLADNLMLQAKRTGKNKVISITN